MQIGVVDIFGGKLHFLLQIKDQYHREMYYDISLRTIYELVYYLVFTKEDR